MSGSAFRCAVLACNKIEISVSRRTVISALDPEMTMSVRVDAVNRSAFGGDEIDKILLTLSHACQVEVSAISVWFWPGRYGIPYWTKVQ
jgi:hypothetical protein